MLYLLMFIWWAIGVVFFLSGCYNVAGRVIVKDLLVAPVFGLGGPAMILVWLLFSKNYWLNKKIW